MQAGQNGQSQPLPTIHVGWDEKTQNVALEFDPREFRTYPFLIACLEMAIKEADKNWKISQMQAMAQQQAEQQQAQGIVNKLQLGKG